MFEWQEYHILYVIISYHIACRTIPTHFGRCKSKTKKFFSVALDCCSASFKLSNLNFQRLNVMTVVLRLGLRKKLSFKCSL